MKVFNAICLEDKTFSDGKLSLSIKRGNEYTISSTKEDGTVTVLSNCWVSGVDVALFGGILPIN